MPGPHKFSTATPAPRPSSARSSWPATTPAASRSSPFWAPSTAAPWARLSLTGSKPQQKRRFSPLVPGVTHVRYPYAYRGCTAARRRKKPSAWAARATSRRSSSRPSCRPRRWPPSSSSRFRARAATWWRPTTSCASCAAICDRHGILLVVDEVQSARAAPASGGPFEHSGVEPDIVCMAKGIASGMPLGVCMSRAEIMDWVPGSHASTFGGNPVSIAAALATLDIIEREAMANAARVGGQMLERLRGWKQTHPLVGDVRGRGLMIGIELVKDKATREPASLCATAWRRWPSSAA
jgi:4-aminobutyrate aminotransferase